ncbi:hypothetical protein [Streptomyces sp. HUAS TT20]|uniref:hypothetical protein n=1 Tax=Streptomyces sp. HUAS TT20 TaxID=3447509 RepID=UPI0021D89075|nr:hypothetical protein [Streptomyces sp. HUAS 15-9]UXY29604.1 hypothetical protein N8I87_25640 [Streptomyces sp. HUAS 15-9]
MSSHRQHGNGADGVNDANDANGTPEARDAHEAGPVDGGPVGGGPAGGGPAVVPNVYHPQAAAAPAYDGYADPATAHGWQNAYDETCELPRMTDETAPLPAPVAA